MARKTRRGQVQAAASRSYHSTPTAREQVHFPARRTTVVKTYSTRKTASARSLRQQTLTQIDYVKQAEAGDADDSALLESPSKPERPKKRRKTMGDTPNSSFHTQTLTQFLSEKGDNDQDDDLLQIKDSDGEDDKDVWEIPEDDDELPTLPRPKGSSSKRKQPTRDVKPEESKTKGRGETKGKGKGKEVLFAAQAPSTPSSKRIKVNLDEVPSSQPTPFTPFGDQEPLWSKRQPPLGNYRSPLKERSTNDAPEITEADISKRPRNMVIQDSYRAGSSAQFSPSLAGSSPIKKIKETPDRRPRREPLAELPLGSYDLGEDAGDDGPDQETPTRPRTGSSHRVHREIPDSDAELESVSSSPLKSRSTQSQARRTAKQESQGITNTEDLEVNIAAASTPGSVVRIPQTPHKTRNVLAAQSSQRAPPESPVIYTDPNAPTPKTPAIYEDPELSDQVIEAHPPPENTDKNEDQDTVDPAAETPQPKARVVDDDSASTASESEDGPDPGTPTPVAKKVQIQLPPSSVPEADDDEEIFRETPRRISPRKRSPRKSSPLLQRHTQRHTQARSQLYSQGLESQRVPLDVIRNMGPITDTSDILISIHPGPLQDIVAGTKDHEFRPYKFPTGATRLWIYTTRPVGEVRYMARIGPPRKRGEPNSQSGLGNAEFNQGELEANMHAYELIQVYELNNPVQKAEMKEHGMGDKSPHRYRVVPPAIVGQLLGNLKRKLFAEGDELDEDEDVEEDNLEGGEGGGVAMTVSQELEEQIWSDIIGSTQMVPRSSQEVRHAAHEEIIPASQEESSRTGSAPVKEKENTTPQRTSRPVGKSKSAAPATATTTSIFAQPRQDDDVFARPALPRPAQAPAPAPAPVGSRFSSRIRSQRSQQQLQRVPSYGDNGMVRPSQATTASEISSPGGSPSKTSPLLSSVPRPSTSSVPDALLREFDDDCSSPILGLGALGTASQVNRLVMQDSLMVDEVRAPPQRVIWDSDEDEEGEEDGVLPTL